MNSFSSFSLGKLKVFRKYVSECIASQLSLKESLSMGVIKMYGEFSCRNFIIFSEPIKIAVI